MSALKTLSAILLATFALGCATAPNSGVADEQTARAGIAVFGHTVTVANEQSATMLRDLAAAPDTRPRCESKGGETTCCAQDKPGEDSPGVCCTAGGAWVVTCEIVSCKADGNCYDREP